MPTASITYSPDFLVTGFRRYRRQHWWRFVSLAIKALGFVMLGSMGFWLLREGALWIGLLLAALGVFVLFSHHLDYWLVRRSVRKSPYCGEEVTIEFSDAGFHARSPKQDVRLDWSAFTKVAHFRDGFLLFQGPRFFSWIPVSSLEDPSQVAALEELLASKISEHKIVDRVVGVEREGAP